jgi:hypothetical protein
MRLLSQIFGVIAFFTLVPSGIMLILYLDGSGALIPPGTKEHCLAGLVEGVVFTLLSQWFWQRAKRKMNRSDIAPNQAAH